MSRRLLANGQMGNLSMDVPGWVSPENPGGGSIYIGGGHYDPPVDGPDGVIIVDRPPIRPVAAPADTAVNPDIRNAAPKTSTTLPTTQQPASSIWETGIPVNTALWIGGGIATVLVLKAFLKG